jgi:transcriptional regulator with XRE-family HTH domain
MYHSRSQELGLRSQKGTMVSGKKSKRMMKAFGLRLRASRIAAGYVEGQDLAKDLACEAPRYRQWERGDAMPPIDFLEMICDLTGKTSDFLLFGRTDRPH